MGTRTHIQVPTLFLFGGYIWCIYTHQLLACTDIIYIYIHIHIHIHIYIYTYIHRYIYTYIHIYIFTFIHLYQYTFIPIYIYTYIHTYIYTYIHIYIYTNIHIYIYANIHIYIYATIHIYIYIYIYIYIHIYNILIHVRIYIYNILSIRIFKTYIALTHDTYFAPGLRRHATMLELEAGWPKKASRYKQKMIYQKHINSHKHLLRSSKIIQVMVYDRKTNGLGYPYSRFHLHIPSGNLTDLTISN